MSDNTPREETEETEETVIITETESVILIEASFIDEEPILPPTPNRDRILTAALIGVMALLLICVFLVLIANNNKPI